MGTLAHTRLHAESVHVYLQETQRGWRSELSINAHDAHKGSHTLELIPRTREGSEKENEISQAEQALKSHSSWHGKQIMKYHV